MPSKKRLTACLDANVIISAVLFGGIPAKVFDSVLDDEFNHVTSEVILDEARRNISRIGSGITPDEVSQTLHRLALLSTLVQPTGRLKFINYQPDNLVLETAILGDCDILVTGDKKDLLPLKCVEGVTIEPPSAFLKRL